MEIELIDRRAARKVLNGMGCRCPPSPAVSSREASFLEMLFIVLTYF
jgi:hypothetical protein